MGSRALSASPALASGPHWQVMTFSRVWHPPPQNKAPLMLVAPQSITEPTASRKQTVSMVGGPLDYPELWEWPGSRDVSRTLDLANPLG